MLAPMERAREGVLTAVAMIVSAGVLIIANPDVTAVASTADGVVILPNTLTTLAVDDQPIERQIGGLVQNVFRQIRWTLRTMGWMFWRALDWWGSWIRSLAFSLAVAVVAALADGGLVTAWRGEGIRSLLTYSALMLYVYTRLLFSGGVNLAPKLLLVGALIYGVVRRDLVPDQTLVPGRVEDVIFIAVATRAFVYACPDELVNQYAERAVRLKRRVLASSRTDLS
jgi:uncharacterized membrane protein YkvA (DUF1232 family)